jgi:DNA-binding transcriptional LysR family regulator
LSHRPQPHRGHFIRRQRDRGELHELLPSCRPEPIPISVVYPSGRLLPARVRVAIDALEVLRQRTGSPGV